ncbi:prepilin-type N-terminal cleavage/methylation domain-containing protein [Clostridium perfringens]|nr:prepilin-type N-terminal cleavage/methylation domain-containing protein [Clostridium perfringens]
MNTKKQNKKKKGFTLIELIIVIAIIAILAAIAIPNFLSIQRKSKVKADVATAKSIYDTTETLVADGTIKAEKGVYTTDLADVNTTAINTTVNKPLSSFLQKKVVSESVNGGVFRVKVTGNENEPVVKVYLDNNEIYPSAKLEEYQTDSNKGDNADTYTALPEKAKENH